MAKNEQYPEIAMFMLDQAKKLMTFIFECCRFLIWCGVAYTSVRRPGFRGNNQGNSKKQTPLQVGDVAALARTGHPKEWSGKRTAAS
jgi:hypothetical protein